MTESEEDVAQRIVAQYSLMLAVAQGHPVTRRKRLRLRDLRDVPFVWLHRRANPAYYD